MSKELMIEELLKTPHSKTASGRTEVVVRCPFCGDSVKSNRPHLYIGLEKEPIQFDCKRCEAGGLFTPGVLQRLGVYNTEVIQYVRDQIPLGGATKILNDDGTMTTTKSYIVVPKNINNHQNKIKYLSERTGVDFSKKENIDKFRVVFSIKEFHKYNKIPIKEENRSFIDSLESNGIGFLSHDKKSIQFRDISSSSTRYSLYILNESRSAFMYIPKQEIDTLAERPKIVLTEGPIGVITVSNQFYTSDMTDVIVGSGISIGSLKKAFLRLVELSTYVGGECIVYSDPEVPLSKYQNKIFKLFRGTFSFKIVYNQSRGGTDFNDVKNGFQPKIFQF